MPRKQQANPAMSHVARRIVMLVIVLSMVLAALPAGIIMAEEPSDGGATSRGPVPRIVLGEMFTATWCGPCVNADAGISAIVNDSAYFDDRFVLIEWHSSDNYSTPEGDARSSYYVITGVPTIMFDGQDKVTGSSGSPEQNEATYEQSITARPATADISLKTNVEVIGSTGRVNVNATVGHTLPITEIGLVLNAVVVEDHKIHSQMGHFLRMTAVTMPINSQPITIRTEGSSWNTTADFTIEPNWDLEKLAVVTFIQNSNTRSVLQAGIGYPSTSKPPPSNQPPQFTGGELDFSMDEDTQDTHLNLETVFQDPEGDPMTYNAEGSVHISASVDSSHVLTVTPAAEWSGTETIYVSAKDPYHSPTSSPVTVTVKPINDPPVLKGKLTGLVFDEDTESTTSALSSIFSDPEGGTISYKIENTVHVKIVKNPSTTLTISPVEEWSGTENLVVTASDGTYETVYEDDIVVRQVNDPPEINDYAPKQDYAEVKEGDSISYSVYADDPEGDDLDYKWEVDGVSEGISSSTFKYEPQYGDAGSHTIVVEVTDGDASTAHTFHVTVLQGNRAPTVKITSPAEGREYTEGDQIVFMADVADPDDPYLRNMEFTWELDGTPQSNDAQFTAKPSTGSHTVTLIVNDGVVEVEDTLTFSVKEKGGSTTPGFDALPLFVAIFVSMALVAWRRLR